MQLTQKQGTFPREIQIGKGPTKELSTLCFDHDYGFLRPQEYKRIAYRGNS
jgi:hypothetical protein